MVFTTYYWLKNNNNNIVISVRSWDLCHNLLIGACCWTWTAVGKHSLLAGDKMMKRFQCLTLNSNLHVWVDKIFQKIFCLKPLTLSGTTVSEACFCEKLSAGLPTRGEKLFHYKLFYMFLILTNYPIIHLLLKTLKA